MSRQMSLFKNEVEFIRNKIVELKISDVTSSPNDEKMDRLKRDILNFLKALPGVLNKNKHFENKLQQILRSNSCLVINVNKEIVFDSSLEKLQQKLKGLPSQNSNHEKKNLEIMSFVKRLTIEDITPELLKDLKKELRFSNLKTGEEQEFLSFFKKIEQTFLSKLPPSLQINPVKNVRQTQSNQDIMALKKYIEILMNSENSDSQLNRSFDSLHKEVQTLFKPLHNEVLRMRNTEKELISMLNTNVKGNQFFKKQSSIRESFNDILEQYHQLKVEHNLLSQKIQQLSNATKIDNRVNRDYFLQDLNKLHQDQVNELKSLERFISKYKETNFQAKPKSDKSISSDPLNVKKSGQKQQCTKQMIKIADLEQQKDKLNKDLEKLRKQVENNKKDDDLKNKRIKFLEGELLSLKQYKNLPKVSTSSKKIEEQLNQEKNNSNKLKQKNQALQNTIKQLEGERRKDKELFQNQQKKVKKLMTFNKTISTTEDQAKGQMTQNVAFLRDQNQSLVSQIEMLSSENTKLKNEIVRISIQNSSRKNKGLNEDDVRSSSEQNELALKNSIKNLQEQIESKQLKLKQLQRKNLQLIQKSEKYDDIILQEFEKKSIIDNLTQNLQQCKKAYAQIKERVDNKLNQLNATNTPRKNASSPSKQREFVQKEKGYQQNIENLEKENQKKSETIVSLQKKVGDLERQLTNSKCEQTKKTLIELEEKEREKSKQLNDLKILLQKKEQEILIAKGTSAQSR